MRISVEFPRETSLCSHRIFFRIPAALNRGERQKVEPPAVHLPSG